jgi:CAAX prenyl protease-like protein
MAKRRLTGYGWAPYWMPMLAFLGLVELGNRGPESWDLALLALKLLLPGGCLVWYASRGAYPELRDLRGSPLLLADVMIGLLGAALWVGPFLLFPGLRPEIDGFAPEAFGESETLVWCLRGLGYAVITPFVEELFVRSWLLRFLDVFDQRKDFRKVPIGRFRWRSFIGVTLYFVFTHQSWEWGVMLGWTLLTMAWFYHRRSLSALVIVHAVTNGAIFALVALGEGRFSDPDGVPIGLRFLL